jgi:pyruvate/2-oxoglutarate dehydrogenase complex dihydrolipoamide dehydrogenase (E3) component
VEKVNALSPYGVIIAAGGSPIVPNIPGVNDGQVYKAEDVLAGNVSLKNKKVLIIGGGVTGLETAEFMASENGVTVVEMLDAVGTALYPSVRIGLLRRLEKAGVKIITGESVSKIENGKVTLRNTKTALPQTIGVEAVVLAVGIRPDKAFAEEFREAFDKVIVVGDASEAGQIGDAMKEANDKAFVF